MDTVYKPVSGKTKGWGRGMLGAVAGLALLGAGSPSFADSPYAMAPPIDAPYATSIDSANIFGWQDVPQDQRVPIRRAVFDQGGYQLFDTVGETIVVPFTNQNLYAMKFGVSDNGTTYFVNAGDAPVLYIPRNGYLENAGVSGSRWYPFPKQFHESTPVFIGLAPSWDDFCTMGWYPDMVCYGGYWGRSPYLAGRVYEPTFGLTFVIGGSRYDGWEPYHRYYDYHPAPYRVTVLNRNVYNIYNDRERNFNGHRDYSAFRGTGHSYDAGRADRNNGDFRSVRPTAPISDRTFGNGGNNGRYNNNGGNRTFDGGNGNNRTLSNGGNSRDNNANRNRTFNGASGDRTFGNPSGDHTFGNPSGNRTFNSPSGDRTFGGVGRTPSASPGRPVFNGARPDAGTHSDTSTSDRTIGGGNTSGTPGRTFGRLGGDGRYNNNGATSRPSDTSTSRPTFDSSASRPSSSSDRGSRPASNGGRDRGGGRATPQSTDNAPRSTDTGSGNNGSRPQFQNNSRPVFNGGGSGRGGR